MHTFILPADLHAAIIAHARAGWPEEVCGLVRGKEGRASDIRRAQNVAANPVMDYEIAAADLLVQFDWEDAGDELIAIYHSHPVSPAYPSASDAWNAHYPDAIYLICSLADAENPVLKGFLLRPLAGKLDLAAVRAELAFDETRPGRWGAYLRPDQPLPASLTQLDPPPSSAIYVVYERQPGAGPVVRAVSVQAVEMRSA